MFRVDSVKIKVSDCIVDIDFKQLNLEEDMANT